MCMYLFDWCAALSLHIDGYLFDWCAAALVRLEALLEVGQRSQEHALLHQIQESIDCLRCKIAKRLLKDTMCWSTVTSRSTSGLHAPVTLLAVYTCKTYDNKHFILPTAVKLKSSCTCTHIYIGFFVHSDSMMRMMSSILSHVHFSAFNLSRAWEPWRPRTYWSNAIACSPMSYTQEPNIHIIIYSHFVLAHMWVPHTESLVKAPPPTILTLAHFSVASGLVSESSFMIVPRTCRANSLVLRDATWGDPERGEEG